MANIENRGELPPGSSLYNRYDRPIYSRLKTGAHITHGPRELYGGLRPEGTDEEEKMVAGAIIHTVETRAAFDANQRLPEGAKIAPIPTDLQYLEQVQGAPDIILTD